ncbi:MAG: c-type cytochrome [Gemmatimonadota bacterium]
MNRAGAVLIAGLLLPAVTALAQQNTGLGRYEYHARCASCHGLTGKGDGPMAKYLKHAPADLTTLARRNGGTFPTQLVWQVIDGRPAAIGSHGSRDMPVWGQEYRTEVSRPGGPPQPESYVAGRITALIDYLSSIQAK